MIEFGNKATVLIVDDHPLVRAGLVNRISLEPDLKIFGQVHWAT